jgi:tetratricopeptide (TPR) repeat protein
MHGVRSSVAAVLLLAAVGGAAAQASGETAFEAFGRGSRDYFGCQERNDFERALSACTRLIRDAAGADAYMRRASLFSFTGDHGRALADLDAAIGLAPGEAAAYVARGLTHLDKDERERAVADFRRALALEPGHRRAPQLLRALGETP